MNEDERYRTSTQFRLWSFTPERLAEMRSITNKVAAERVKEAIKRARASRTASASASGETSETEQNGADSRAASMIPEGEVNCLTVEEELKLVAFYCQQTLQLGDHLKVPTDVKVRTSALLCSKCAYLIVVSIGNSNPIHETLLHHQFPHDLPPDLYP